MYKEERTDSKQKKRVFLGAFVLLAACFGVMWFTADRPGSAALQAVALFGCVAAVFLVLRFALRKYTYGVDDEEVTLLLQQGSRLPVIVSMPIPEIEAFEPLTEENARASDGRREDFCFSLRREYPKYLLRGVGDGECRTVIFQPSDRMREEIEKRLRREPKEEGEASC